MAETPEKELIAQSEYFKRNIDGKWKDVEVTAEEIDKIKKEVNSVNVAILRRLKAKYGSGTPDNFSDEIILALWEKLVQHYHHAAETFVTQQLDKQHGKR